MPVTINGSSGLTANDGSVFTNASGNVGIGTSSPSAKLHTYSATGAIYNYVQTGDGNNAGVRFRNSLREYYIINNASGALDIYDATAAVSRMTLDTFGNLSFNSGYGSNAVAYGCRAWVNFNGVGTVSIRASGNVSSITDNGTGDYTVNFTSALVDANYSAVASAQPDTSAGIGTGNAQCNISIVGTSGSGALPSTSGFRIWVGYAGGNPRDVSGMYCAVFR